MLEKIVALLLSILLCLSQLNASATWVPALLFPSEEINTGNRTCSIATFKPLEKSVIHGGWTIPTSEGSQILHLGMFGEQNLTECLEVFSFSSGLVNCRKAAAQCDAYPHMCNWCQRWEKSSLIRSWKVSYAGNFPLHGVLIHAFFERPLKIDCSFHLWSVLPQISMSLISHVNRAVKGRHWSGSCVASALLHPLHWRPSQPSVRLTQLCLLLHF